MFISISGVGLVDYVPSTQVFLLVGSGLNPERSTRSLTICVLGGDRAHFSTLFRMNYADSILAVVANSTRVAVALASEIFLYAYPPNLKEFTLKMKCEVSGNMSSTVLTMGWDNSLLAFPSSPTAGLVSLFDAEHFHAVTASLSAHTSPVTCLTINRAGSLLATSSKTATTVRIFAIPGGQCLSVFRRGFYSADIMGLQFDDQSSLVCAPSDSGKMHIFRMSHPNQNGENEKHQRRSSRRNPNATSRSGGSDSSWFAWMASWVIPSPGGGINRSDTDSMGANDRVNPSSWTAQRHFAFASVTPSGSSSLPSINTAAMPSAAAEHHSAGVVTGYWAGLREVRQGKVLLSAILPSGDIRQYLVPRRGGECRTMKEGRLVLA